MAFPRKNGLAVAFVAFVLLVAASIIMLQSSRKPPRDDRASVREPTVAASAGAVDDETRRVARTRWEERRAQIRAAHARAALHDRPAPHAPASRACADADCSPDAPEKASDASFAAFIDETTTLTQGCEELIGEKPKSVRITARLIGAPDVGTIVESVDVSGSVEHADELTECLTEGMYTLELGAAQTTFQRDAVLMLGLLDEVASEGWLSPERVAEIRQQMIDGGLDPSTDPMVSAGANDPSSMQ